MDGRGLGGLGEGRRLGGGHRRLTARYRWSRSGGEGRTELGQVMAAQGRGGPPRPSHSRVGRGSAVGVGHRGVCSGLRSVDGGGVQVGQGTAREEMQQAPARGGNAGGTRAQAQYEEEEGRVVGDRTDRDLFPRTTGPPLVPPPPARLYVGECLPGGGGWVRARVDFYILFVLFSSSAAAGSSNGPPA